jgi:hypothetical protein
MATVAAVSGLYSWRERWQAARDDEAKALEELDNAREDPGVSNSQWFELDQKAQGLSRKRREIEDEKPD